MSDKAKCIIALGAFVIFTFIGYKLLPKDEVVIQVDDNKTENRIYVHIEGCVHSPGIKEVTYGTRLYELIEIAGGETMDADLSKVNLATILSDEQKVYIPEKIVFEEVETNTSTQNMSNAKHNTKNMLININVATRDELKTLSGIGDAMAKRIIDFRENEGYFNSIEDIMNVEGIGQAKFNKIKDNITT